MIPLKDLTILIALKVDSKDRVDNLDIVMQYLQHHFDTNIVICEQDTEPKLSNRYNCKHVFYETDEFFNRQRGVNIAAKHANTSVIAHYDADILLQPYQIQTSYGVINGNEVDVIYPYNGFFYDVPKHFHKNIKDTNSVSGVDLSQCTLFNKDSVGGAVFFKTSVFWEAGGANERFRGLGYEDNEIFIRFNKLGYRFGRVTDPLYHLNHDRKETSFNYNPYIEINKAEMFRVERMSKEQLQQEVKTWKYDNV